jgi:hypothetical protein
VFATDEEDDETTAVQEHDLLWGKRDVKEVPPAEMWGKVEGLIKP